MLGIAVLAGLVYGSWAALCNIEYGSWIALKAGLGQGGYALFSTWIVTWVAVNLYLWCKKGWLGFLLGFVCSFLVMLSIPIAIHSLLNTPNMWSAIMPGLIWGSGYILVYLWRFSAKLQTSPVAFTNHRT